MASRLEREAVGDAIRADARRLCISNDTVGWFLESATPRQLDAVAGMLAHEIAVRERNRKARLLRKAAFPAVKSVSGFDFSDVRMPDGHTVEDMLSLDWIGKAQDHVFHGQTGRGKTRLAVAIGMTCVERGLTVRYLPCAHLVLQLHEYCAPIGMWFHALSVRRSITRRCVPMRFASPAIAGLFLSKIDVGTQRASHGHREKGRKWSSIERSCGCARWG